MSDDLFTHADSRERRLLDEVARLRAENAGLRAELAAARERPAVAVVGSGQVLALPSAAWGGFVAKEARRALDALNPRDHAPKHVARVLDRVRAYRRKADLPEDAIEADAAMLERELWAEIGRLWSEIAGQAPGDRNGGAQ
jgi:hypothetical protein